MKSKRARGIYGVLTGPIFIILGVLEVVILHRKSGNGQLWILGVAIFVLGLFMLIMGLINLLSHDE